MKSILFFLGSFIVLSQNLYSQMEISLVDADTIADTLVSRNLLTPRGKTILLRELKERNLEVDHPSTVYPISYTSTALTKEAILQFCLSALITETAIRISSTKYNEKSVIDPEPLIDTVFIFRSMDFIGAKKGYEGVVSPQTSIMGASRRRTFETFIAAGLLLEDVQTEVANALTEKKIKNEKQLAQFCLERSVYYSWYSFNKQEQIKYIGELHAAEIIDKEGKDSLVSSFKDKELKSLNEMLAPSRYFQRVDYTDRAPEPAIAYDSIFKKIKLLIPEFNYQDLNIGLVKSNDDGLIREDLRIRFSVQGIPYAYEIFYDYHHPDPSQDQKTEPNFFQEDFQKPVNKWLTDIESPFRLHIITERSVTARKLKDPRHSSIGMILLKEGQAPVVSKEVNIISTESYDTRMSRKNILRLQTELEQEGFFAHLDPKTRDSVKGAMLSAALPSFLALLAIIPATIVSFDFEMVNLDNPYEELTHNFINATRGASAVTKVVDGYSKASAKSKTVPYGFTMNGKTYHSLLVYKDDWIDPNFSSLIARALKENKVNGRFYECKYEGEFSGFLFLTPNQYNFMLANYPDLIGSPVE